MDAPLFQVLVEQSDDDFEHADLESVELIEESTGMLGPQSGITANPTTLRRLAPGLLVLLAVSLMCSVASRVVNKGPAKAAVDKNVRLNAAAVAAYDSAEKTLQAIGASGAKLEQGVDFIQTTNFTDMLVNMNNTLKLLGLKGINLKRLNPLRDGNPCPDDEETFEGLCYQKCASLTQGRYPIRTTAFSCCMREPCSFFNSKFTNPLKFCQGYDVGGHDKYGCPHAPGDCLLNEEFHMGVCYKKCALLTQGEFPYRSSAETCCKHNAYLDCLEGDNFVVNANFSIGGGAGDDLLEAEMGQVHPPIPALAEEVVG